MKYAIFGDIHGNLEALEAVLADSHEQQCTHSACLGDLVGYCANPAECVARIRSMGITCVKGNYDEYCSSDEPLKQFQSQTARLIGWTRLQLSDGDKAWLKNLKPVEVVDGFTIVHATLHEPERWMYVFDKLAAAPSLERQATPLCFFGHTHVPIAFVRDSMIRGGTYSKIRVEKEKRYFINPGSVGQPRDGDHRAAYVTYQLETGVIELRRVEYDRSATLEKLKRFGF